jgi:hypothetical protein
LTDDVAYTQQDKKGPSRGGGGNRLKVIAIVLVALAAVVVLGNALGVFDRFKSGSGLTNPNEQLTAEDKAQIEEQMQEEERLEQGNEGFREDLILGDN